MQVAGPARFTPRVEHSENDVEYNCINWLQQRGWIADRVQVGLFYTRDGRPVSIGKPGQPDWRFKRGRQYMEIEFKRPNANADKRQLEYLALMKHCGVLATWADGLLGLQQWYADQGFD
jgi:hypothetical protein